MSSNPSNFGPDSIPMPAIPALVGRPVLTKAAVPGFSGLNTAISTGGMPTTTSSVTPRPSVIQLAIKEKAALYAAYIPLLKEGGIFIPSTKDYKLGDDIYLLLSLPNEPQRYPVAGKVAWVTPPQAANNRTQGVGVHFPADEKSRVLKHKIEEILGAHLGSERPTQTI
jgi:type IV pilus assembly protein PilZ